MKEWFCYSGNIEGELCTPTGAALLKYYVNEFGNMPAMIMEKQGYGMGNKDFPVANCIRSNSWKKDRKQFNYGK
ncbi:MAG: nickel insertion protein [Eubacterium sp.]